MILKLACAEFLFLVKAAPAGPHGPRCLNPAAQVRCGPAPVPARQAGMRPGGRSRAGSTSDGGPRPRGGDSGPSGPAASAEDQKHVLAGRAGLRDGRDRRDLAFGRGRGAPSRLTSPRAISRVKGAAPAHVPCGGRCPLDPTDRAGARSHGMARGTSLGGLLGAPAPPRRVGHGSRDHTAGLWFVPGLPMATLGTG
jgi:hypothetical protein